MIFRRTGKMVFFTLNPSLISANWSLNLIDRPTDYTHYYSIEEKISGDLKKHRRPIQKIKEYACGEIKAKHW